MIVAVALFELYIEYAQSLKEKRMVVKSLRDRIRNRFEVSCAEVAFQDLHQRARLSVAAVTTDAATADSILDRIHAFVETETDAVLAGWTVEKLDFDEEAGL